MYSEYLNAIKNGFDKVLRFDEYLSSEVKPASFCLIRHDVDRRPGRALAMAELEANMGVKSTFYFRTREYVMKKDIILAIHDMGHEVGYHYECLSDAHGDVKKALELFAVSLNKLRELAPVRTVSMHGRPMSRHDNRDMWRGEDALARLREEFELLGEIYLHIDYTDIAYINDTGRNWQSGKDNKRDQVKSEVEANFDSGVELMKAIRGKNFPRMVFQVHPERWTDNAMAYRLQQIQDLTANLLKRIL